MSNFDFSIMEKVLYNLDADHSSTQLTKLKNELNKFFTKAKCKEVLYTNNTDRMFFGMRVYPVIDDEQTMEIMGDEPPKPIDGYYIEIDSKLYDPLVGLNAKEMTAILLHEVGHIVYDTSTINKVKFEIDEYFAASGDCMTLKPSKGYRELLAYALKDAIMKTGSLFSKIGDDEMIADSFVVACGYGPDLETAIRKISTSNTFLNKQCDNRLITLAWVLRLKTDLGVRRISAIKTLNKAKQLTNSKLEEREINYAVNVLNKLRTIEEAKFEMMDSVRDRFSAKFKKFKINGIRAIKDDVYELNLKLRCSTTEEDLAYVIRSANSDIAILQDYLSEDIPDYERKTVEDALQQFYDIRQRAAKEKNVFNPSDSAIQVIYTN